MAGTELTQVETVVFKRVVIFSDGCDTIELEETCELGPLICQNFPAINCISEFGGIRFEIVGEQQEDPFMVVFQYTLDNGESWRTWDGNPILNCDFLQVKATVMYQGCPDVYLESVDYSNS